MFDIGWTEMLVIAIVMIVVVGPKDLPNMLRTFGRTTTKLRGMAADFQKQFNDALKEAELDDVKKSVDSLRSLNPAAEIRKQLNPFEQAAADVRSGVDAVMKPKPAIDPVTPAASPPQETELKNGATVLPGVSAPEAAPAAPIFPAMTDESVVPSPVGTATPAAPQKASAAKKKPAPAKAMPAPKAAAKPAAAARPAVTKTAAKKAEPKPAPAAVKKPTAAAKKTAGASK
ncbi:MAG: twin-arginine translocase subunit TatB [Mesorhizobium sp.]|uniref:Sec-independent protein translocase protein TatB n=1 Tax=unclassified Mesorhizobium TaxID=325217 RepID=UPI000F75FB56|nr:MULTISPECIES: Sec-independent protein translocase protein TatB [unclassified Mesorhizobium]RUU25409.1 twin-arginine translocase subunit TatB [Mesorhizobium sp. M6A.T.Ca.TU.002.02.2.1]AZO67949.1 twin-arginine translocase subunit TatB [Mesorhizobium sp. M6A.T.Cr.TU.016.01.1.1]RUU26816.1 twin-arginine translocase subunit TatB [Mesorhizobium sp. M6A.T.Ce.TU.016.01.1.1]RUU96913.1 twin-arginine translocase subunit TatB [Mesorhizobium sp. M6A.T.Cr.TU.017.01.1.1]RVB75076.1 twin-arginine translocase